MDGSNSDQARVLTSYNLNDGTDVLIILLRRFSLESLHPPSAAALESESISVILCLPPNWVDHSPSSAVPGLSPNLFWSMAALLSLFAELLGWDDGFADVSPEDGFWTFSVLDLHCFSNIICKYFPCSSIRNCNFLWICNGNIYVVLGFSEFHSLHHVNSKAMMGLVQSLTPEVTVSYNYSCNSQYATKSTCMPHFLLQEHKKCGMPALSRTAFGLNKSSTIFINSTSSCSWRRFWTSIWKRNASVRSMLLYKKPRIIQEY